MALIPENYYNSSSPEAKAELLQQSAENKLTQLSNKRDAVLLGLNDGDSLITSEGIIREQATNGMYYDANELPKKGFEADKSSRAMQYQDLLTARKVGKDVANITDQDRLDVANWQQIQKLADIVNGPGVWEAPFARGVEKTNLTGRYVDEYGVVQEAPLNVPMTIATNGQVDKFGRKLGQVGSIDGIDVTTASASNPQLNARYRSKQPSGVSLTEEDIAKGKAAALDRVSILDRAANVGKAMGAMAAGGVYDLADMAVEAAGSAVGKNWDLGSDDEKTKAADKLFGYDRRFTQAAGEDVKNEIARMNEEGWDVKGVWNILKRGISTPEFLGESLGYLAPMLVGGPTSVGGKALLTANRALKVAEAAGDAVAIGKAAEGVKAAREAYTATKQALDFVSKNAGLLGVSAGTTNDDLDKYAESVGIDKKDVDPMKVAGTFVGNVVLNSIDRWTDIGILKSPEMKDGLIAVVKGMSQKQLSELGSGLAHMGKSTVASGAKEGSTEYVQTFIEQINQQVGEQAGKTVADAWNNEENRLERATAGALGVTGAQQMDIASIGVSGLKGGVSAGVDKVRDEIAKTRAEKDATNGGPGVSVEDRLANVGSMMGTDGSSLYEVRQQLDELEPDIDVIDDMKVKQSYLDARKAYQEKLNTYTKDVETTGKLDSRSYNAEPEFYLDMLAAATDKEAIAKAIENDAELQKNYGKENVAGLVKTLRDIDTNRNVALDELVQLEKTATGNQTMEGVKHDSANLGFITSENAYPSLAQYVQSSFRTGKVDPRLVNFAAYQESKLGAVKAGYEAAKNEVGLFIRSIAANSNMSEAEVAKGLAYLEGRTVKEGKVGAKIDNIAGYVKLGARLLGMPENSSWKEVSGKYKESQLKKDIKGIKLASVEYSNKHLGRNSGKFQFNTYEILGDVAQDHMKGETDTLGVSGAKMLIEQVEKEVSTLKRVVGRAVISMNILAEMKQTYRMYQNDKGQAVTSGGEVVETQEGPDVGSTPAGSTDETKANTSNVVGNKEKLEVIKANKELLTRKQQESLRSLPTLFDDVADSKIDKLYNKVQKELGRKEAKEQKAAARKETAKANEEAKAKAAANRRKKTPAAQNVVVDVTNEEDKQPKNMITTDVVEPEISGMDAEERLDAVVEAVEDHVTDPTVDSTVELIAKVEAIATNVNDIEEYDVEDVESVLEELQGSEFVQRVKELVGHSAQVDMSEEAKEFDKAVIAAAAEERIAEITDRDAAKQLKMQKVRVGKAIEKVKGLVDKSKAAVSKAFDIAKQEMKANKDLQKQLEKARAELHRKADIARDARQKLDDINKELAKKEAELVKAKDEADAVFEINEELSELHYKTVETLKAAVKKLVASAKKQKEVINAIDTAAVEAELKSVNAELAKLMKRRAILDEAKAATVEQKRLASTALAALVDEARVLRQALKTLQLKYSNTEATKKTYEKNRTGFSSALKVKDKGGNETASIKLSNFVAFVKDGAGSRVSSVGARVIMNTEKAQKALDKLIARMKKVVANPSTIEKLDEKIVANASPGTILLVNLNPVKDGDGKNVEGAEKPIDENAALALKMAMMEAVEEATMTSMDDSDLERIYGEANVADMSFEQKQALLEMGMPTKYIASKIAKIGMRLLGMTKKYDENGKQVDAEQYERLEMSFGRFGVRLAEVEKKLVVTEIAMSEYLERIGLTEEAERAKKKAKESGSKEATMSLVKVAKDITVEAIRAEYNMWNNYVLIVDRDNDVVFEKPRNAVLKQSNNEITDMPLESQANMTDMMKQEWHLKGVDDETSAMHDLLQMNEHELMLLEGYDSRVDSEEDSKYLPEQLQKTIKGQNLSVRKAVEGLKGLANKILSGLENNSFWHKFSFAKSGRSFVDSNGFNGQGTKLHRHMLFSKQQMSNVSLDKESSDYKITMLAIAQNMGQDTDKLGLSESIKLGETLLGAHEQLEDAWEERKAAVKAGKAVDEKIKIELKNGDIIVVKAVPVSAFADALDAIRAINDAISDGKSTVALTLTLEADGITNGFALKMLQVMWSLDDTESVLVTEWLEKTGIKIWDKDNKGKDATGDEGIAGMIGAGKLIDSYRTLAQDMTEGNVKKNIKDAINKMVKQEAGKRKEEPEYTDPVLAEITEMFGKGENEGEANVGNVVANLQGVFAVATKVFGALTDKDGKVTSFARALMKPPFMTFMYGAGDFKMMSELAGSLIDELLIKLSTYHKLEKGDVKESIDELLATLFPDVKGDRVQWIINYRSGATDIDGNGVDPIKVMRVAFMNTYGAAAVGILKDKFKPLVEINKQIRSAMALVADVWAVAYEDAVKRLANGKVPTKDQYMQALEETKELFPVIKGPFSANRNDGIAIFKKKLASGIASQFAQEETELSAGMVKPGQSSAYVKEGDSFMQKMLPLLTHIYVEAATAAAVIPIHTLDGAIMSRAIKGKGVMQIFDAIMLGITQAVGIVKEYNKTLFDINMEWHYLDNVLDAVGDTIAKAQKDERLLEVARGSWDKYGKEITKLQYSAKKSRITKDEMQKRGVTVSNMLLVKDSEYLVEPKQKEAIIEELNALSPDKKAKIVKAAGKDFDTLVKEIKENC